MEKPGSSPREGAEALPPLDAAVHDLRDTMGIPRQELPANATRPQMHERALELAKDNTIADFHELSEWSKLRFNTRSLDMQSALEDPQRKQQLDMMEFSTVREGVTYSEYLQRVLEHTTVASERYLALKNTVKVVPEKILAQEPKLLAFVKQLNTVTQQRLLFSNATLIQYQLQTQKDLRGEAQQNQGQLLARLQKEILPKLDAASVADLQTNNTDTLQKRLNQLDQQIVDLLAKDGALPGEMLLGLLSQAYAENVKREQAAVRGVILSEDQARLKVLIDKNNAAAAGKGDPLTELEAEEYKRLTRLNEDAQKGTVGVRSERKQLTADTHGALDAMVDFHVDMASLTAERHKFKPVFPLDGAAQLDGRKTPEDVQKKIAEVMDMRKEFHLQRLDRYAERFNEEVLTVGWKELVEDFSNTSGREFVRVISNKMATIYTLPVPETFGLKGMAQDVLAGPLQESLGWPRDKLDVEFKDLEPDEQQAVMVKMTSIKTLVEQFDRSKIRNLRESIAVLRGLPKPTKEELGAAIRDPLPTERVTPQNVEQLKQRYGLATVFIMVMNQLDVDWDGGVEDGAEGGLLLEQRKFFDGINRNLDTHFDVASALFEQSNAWRNLAYGILIAVLGAGALKLWQMWSERSMAERLANAEAEAAQYKRGYESATRDRSASQRQLRKTQQELARERELAAGRERALGDTTRQLDEAKLLIRNQERLAELQEQATKLSRDFDDALKIKDLAARRTALDACVERAKAFQKELNMLDSVMPGARQAVARQVFTMEKLTLSDDAWKVLEEMHSIMRPGNAAADIAETGLYFRVSAENTLKMERLMAASHLAPAEVRVLKKLMRMGVAGQSPTMIRAGMNAGLREARALQQAARVSTGGLHWTHALPIIAVAVDGYIVRQDLFALADAINYPDEVRSQLHAALTHPAAGFTYDAKTETYSKPGMTLRVHEDVLKTLASSKMDAAKSRLTNDITAGALGTSAMFMESGVGIPIGLLIAAGAVTVDMNIHAGERKVALDFIDKSEPWLLAYMGTSITGFQEDDLLYSGLYDLFAEDANIEHREKIMFALFAHCLKQDPKLMRRITGGDFSPESLNAFYAGDFKKFVLPAFSMALFGAQSGKYAEGSAPFSDAKSYRFQSERIQAPNAEPKDVYYACLTALGKYEEKLLEERYVSLSRELELASAEGRYDDALLYDDMLRSLGGETVLGKTLYEVSDELLAHDKELRAASPNARPQTRTDAVLQAYYEKLSGQGKLSYHDMVVQEFSEDGSSPLTLRASEVKWNGASIPPQLRLRGGVVRESTVRANEPRSKAQPRARDDSMYHRFFDLRTPRSSEKTGSVLAKVDPTMHARMFREQVEDLQPYECLNVARKTPGVFVEIGEHESGMKLFGCSTDGEQVTLVGVRGNDVYFKTVQKTGPEPAWQIVRGGEAFANQRDLPAGQRSEAVRTILPLLALPNAYDDEESVRRGIMLYTDLPNAEPLVKQLALMLGTIPSGELDFRKAFLHDLQQGCDDEGMIRHARGVRNIISEVLLPRAKRGAYGDIAKVRMPAVESVLQ